MNQTFTKHRVRFSYTLDNATTQTYRGTMPHTAHVSVLVEDSDTRNNVEILAEHLKVEPHRLTHIRTGDPERTLGYYPRYVRVECTRRFSPDGTKLASQKVQYSRKPFDVILTEYDVTYSGGSTYSCKHYVRIDTDVTIYAFDLLNNRLSVSKEESGLVTMYGFIHIPEDSSVKAAVNAALEAAFEDYAKTIEARIRTIRENNTVWSNINV